MQDLRLAAVVEYGFYHLTRMALEPALGRLSERVLASGQRAVVVASSAERVEALNRALWTFGRDSFLPHGSRDDGFAEDQPVFLTDRADYPNGATVLVLVDGAELEPRAAVRPLPLSVRRQRRRRPGAGAGAVAQVARARRGADLLAADRARLAQGDGGHGRGGRCRPGMPSNAAAVEGFARARRAGYKAAHARHEGKLPAWPPSARCRSSSPTPPGAI